jgi:hypothetical protein
MAMGEAHRLAINYGLRPLLADYALSGLVVLMGLALFFAV